jgi:hypothetical protein
MIGHLACLDSSFFLSTGVDIRPTQRLTGSKLRSIGSTIRRLDGGIGIVIDTSASVAVSFLQHAITFGPMRGVRNLFFFWVPAIRRMPPVCTASAAIGAVDRPPALSAKAVDVGYRINDEMRKPRGF